MGQGTKKNRQKRLILRCSEKAKNVIEVSSKFNVPLFHSSLVSLLDNTADWVRASELGRRFDLKRLGY